MAVAQAEAAPSRLASAHVNAAKAPAGRRRLFRRRKAAPGGRGDRRHADAMIGVLRAPPMSPIPEAERVLTRYAAVMLAGGLLAALTLGGCQKAASGSTDPYAGLDGAIADWRGEIVKSPACAQAPAGGKGCQAFEIGCKVQAPLTAKDKAVTAKIVAAMSWSAWNPARGDYDPASGMASFAKTDGQWVRHDLPRPVNLTTCARS
jgi:hypothetical protein